MKISELWEQLPSGLHDAELRLLSADWLRRTLTIELTLWTGTMDDPRGTEWYRPARLTFTGLESLFIEPPKSQYPSEPPGLLTGERDGFPIDAGEGHPKNASAAIPLSSEAQQVWMFVHSWNAFILLAARAVELEWLGPEFSRE